MDAQICDSPFTIGWLVEKLRLAFDDKSSNLVDWSAKLIGVDMGVCSNIIAVDLEWQKDSKLPGSVVVKVHSMAAVFKTAGDDGNSTLADWGRTSQNTECRAYELFNNISNLAVPRAYFTEEILGDNPGVIVMDSFADRAGFATVLTGLTIAQVLNVADCLAKIHAYSIDNTAGWEKKIDTSVEFVEGLNLMSKVRQLQSQFPQFDGLLDFVSHLVEFPEVQNRIVRETHIDLGLPPVVVHGDIWSNNLIFEKIDGRVTDKLLGIVDWQTARPGCLMEDISRLLVTNCTNQMRREHADYILEFYYNKLCLYLRDEPSFDLETVKEAYKRMMPVSFKWMALSLYFWSHGTALEMEGGTKKENMLKAWTKVQEQADEILILMDSAPRK